MNWAFVAFGLAFVLVIVRSVGISVLQIRWLKAEGKVEQARMRRAYIATLWCGTAFVIVGEFVKQDALKVIGFVVLFSSLIIILNSSIRTIHRYHRTKHK